MRPIHIRFPRLSLKQIFTASLGGGIGIASVLVGVAAYIVNTLTRPKRIDSFMDLYTFTPFELNLPAEEIAFSSLHAEHMVTGWYIAHPEATATILVCPGYHGRRSDVLGVSGQLWKAGYNVLAFEYYGHGSVVGERVTLGYREMNDFLGAVAYAKQRAPQARLGAIGYSMGASIAIMATAQTPEIEALVADSGFATHRSAIAYSVRRTIHLPFALFYWLTDSLLWLRVGYHFKQVEPIRDIKSIAPRSVFIIHGLKDSLVDPEDAKMLYAAAKEPKELWLDPNSDHCGIYFADRQKYIERVVDFLDRNLRNKVSEAYFSEASL